MVNCKDCVFERTCALHGEGAIACPKGVPKNRRPGLRLYIGPPRPWREGRLLGAPYQEARSPERYRGSCHYQGAE